MIDENLRLAGMFYFNSVDGFSDYASKPLNIVPVSHISMGYICDEVRLVTFFGIPWLIEKSGLHIDVVRNVKCPTSTIGNKDDEIAWMMTCGSIGTNMEHAMIKIFYKSKAVSTGMIFAEAAKQGVPIHVLDDPATLYSDLALVDTYTATRNNIISFVNRGYTVMIPRDSIRVEGWLGQGWMALDRETGSAGYMICGGLQGETTMVNGGSSTTIVDHPLNFIETFLYILITAGGPISAVLAHMVAAVEVFTMYPLLGPFCLLGVYVGIALILVGLIAFISIYDSYPLARFIRRKRYAYA